MMLRSAWFLCVIFSLFGLSASAIPFRAFDTSDYVVKPPPGKLPWPQHRPSMTEAEYQAMLRNLWVINNFGLYQGGTTRTTLYFHDGLDIVLDNFTPIYAVQSGYVRANIGGNEFYRTLIIEDADNPGLAWGYTHIYYFHVNVGDYVPQGGSVGSVNFQGLGHIHLSRLALAEGGSWTNFSDLNTLHPDSFFVYDDTQPPVIETPFYYFRNNADAQFPRGSPPVVSGDVDIVVGMRDGGEFAHSKINGFGDRLAVARIEYEIRRPDETVLQYKSFDFRKLTLLGRDAGPAMTQTVYKFYYTIHPAGPPSFDKIMSYYVISNTDGTGEAEVLTLAQQNFAWTTTAVDDQGQPLFPDGDYVITVKAFDAKGNVAAASDTVRVENSSPGSDEPEG
jgi:hypothetical protein